MIQMRTKPVAQHNQRLLSLLRSHPQALPQLMTKHPQALQRQLQALRTSPKSLKRKQMRRSRYSNHEAVLGNTMCPPCVQQPPSVALLGTFLHGLVIGIAHLRQPCSMYSELKKGFRIPGTQGNKSRRAAYVIT